MKKYSLLYTITFLLCTVSCLSDSKKSAGKTRRDEQPQNLQAPVNQKPHDSSIHSKDSTRIPRPKNIRKISETLAKKYGGLIADAPILTKKSIKTSHADTTVKLLAVEQQLIYNSIPDTLRLRLFNYSTDVIMTGLHHELQYWKEGEWEKIKYPQDFVLVYEDIGYRLLPKESTDYIVQLYTDLYSFDKGKYRIQKYYIKDKQAPKKVTHYIYAEFEIK